LEHACQPFIDTLLNAPNLSPWENELIARKIQEIRDAPEAFMAAVQCGEMNWVQARRDAGGLRARKSCPYFPGDDQDLSFAICSPAEEVPS
jgi:hypothetical protein